ncbi:hypothetical protein SAMN05421678_11394 [Actinopolymorpha cephalotaxi]|uniref:Uncharacterized protein n=1 Tax=Actinopolymorpha cephalotaxi TaxID=504797 RepID=A0A1I2XWX0_9ACTN|nr:hypothetical protein [Actinopolymorpha cephalotaxi]SFH17579.1 hypothetical protein SAMN05421678_11394 [Actinopolymorpha cephalotaxi]
MREPRGEALACCMPAGRGARLHGKQPRRSGRTEGRPAEMMPFGQYAPLRLSTAPTVFARITRSADSDQFST